VVIELLGVDGHDVGTAMDTRWDNCPSVQKTICAAIQKNRVAPYPLLPASSM
jgi:hypothetical protein